MATPKTFYTSAMNPMASPAPYPPRYLKRDVYHDPAVFDVVDRHAIDV